MFEHRSVCSRGVSQKRLSCCGLVIALFEELLRLAGNKTGDIVALEFVPEKLNALLPITVPLHGTSDHIPNNLS